METIFRILLPVLILAFALHRGYYVRKHGKEENTLKKRAEGWDSRVANVFGLIGFVAILAYIIQPSWLAWARLPLPSGVRWAGVGVALLGFALLQWAQTALGKSWSDTPRMIKEQTLVTSGPYRFIRHPIYMAFILILGSMILISANWLISLAWIGIVIEVVSRIHFEESLMLEYFGDQYHQYMKRTGCCLPRLLPPPSLAANAKPKTK
jgi:protein-S-isoprenylcysteine O-methyltransferase Ste14